MAIDPASYRTPGQFLSALLKERGWTTQVLAVVLDVSDSLVTRLRTDQRRIDAARALPLGEVFDVDPGTFLDLQNSYDLATASITVQPDPDRKLRANLYGEFPVSEMIKRQWLRTEDIKDFAEVERSLVAFFGVNTLDEIEIPSYAARRSSSNQSITPAQLAWVYRVRSIAEEMVVGQFSPRLLRTAIKNLAELRRHPEDLRKVPRILMDCGIRFVIVETLAGAKIDGVCLWLNDSSPVVGMSLRYDRIDNFWFVLRHELEHVARAHGLSKPMIDIELEGAKAGMGADVDEKERTANEAAAEFCVPASRLSSFIKRKNPFFVERDVLGFAKLIGVHPGVVIGQLQHKTGRYDLLRKHLVSVRKLVAPSAYVDGWGDVMPMGPDV